MSAAKILAKGSFSKCVSISDGKITNPVKTEKVHNRNEQPILRDEKKDLVQNKNSETITIGDDTQAEKKNHRNHSFRDLESIRSCSWRSGRVILLSITRAYFVFYCLIRASRRLRHRMLKSVLRSMIQFYDSNPLGRILSRFSADVGICDVTLPLTITITNFCNDERGTKRNSYNFSFKQQLKNMLDIFEDIQNTHTRAFCSFMASSRWFAFNLDLLSFILTAVASIFSVFIDLGSDIGTDVGDTRGSWVGFEFSEPK